MQRRSLIPFAKTAMLIVAASCSVSARAEPRAGRHATYEIVANGMCCQGCAKKVAAQLYTAPGVVEVKANVSKRTVTVIARPSSKLTLEKLWRAVERAKGEPTQLTTSEEVYTLTPAKQLPAERRTPAGVYVVNIAELDGQQQATKLAASLRVIRGIENLVVDASGKSVTVQTAAEVELSPWTLIGAARQAEQFVTAVTGPYGCLTVEPLGQQAARTTTLSR